MSDQEEPRAPLPTEPLECRQRAEAARSDSRAVVWALLAIAGELADIRRAQAKRR